VGTIYPQTSGRLLSPRTTSLSPFAIASSRLFGIADGDPRLKHWLVIFNDPTLYPDMPADCSSPFLLRSPLAGLLMQVRTILAQPRVSNSTWNAQQASDPTFGLRNTATILHHLGNLWTLFTDWESHPVPRHHCLIGVPDLHRAC
jgi:hypothetical protein